MGTSQNKAKNHGHASGEWKSQEIHVSFGVRWFLMALTFVSLICVPLTSPHDLLETFHNALSKQGCP